MSKEKQIEEMAKDMCSCCKETLAQGCEDSICESVRKHAEALYNSGYRKQSEGEWEQVGDDYFDLCFRCSNCREEFSCEVDMPIFAKFCPNCGAKMKGEKNES